LIRVAEFAGAVALVTGAASGIGRAIALAFAREGAALVLADRDAAGGETVAAEIADGGGDAFFVTCDVADPRDAEALMQAALRRLGRVHHACNNAGITTLADSWDEAVMLRLMAVNLNGVLFGMKHQIAHMRVSGGGTIVNTASIAGLSSAGTVEYCASKHGVVGLTRSAGVRYAREGVRINAVCPGVIETAMTRPLIENDAVRPMLEQFAPLGRFGRAEEVAEAVLFLSSPRSSFIVGHALPVDGGYMAR
jgi:NAD(P)-dependent dehydrogenase (short-subunit alcohol dehydrogenase family)